jgi:hypothetical protein
LQGKLTLYQTSSSAQDTAFTNNFAHPHKILFTAVSLCQKLNIPLPPLRVELIIKNILSDLKFPGIVCIKKRYIFVIGLIIERALFLWGKYFEQDEWSLDADYPLRTKVMGIKMV